MIQENNGYLNTPEPYPQFTPSECKRMHINDLPKADQDRLRGYKTTATTKHKPYPMVAGRGKVKE